MCQKTVFVSGALRSGTTLLKLILDNHTRISNPGEFDFMFDQISSDGSLPEIDAYKDWLANDRIFLASKLKIGQEKTVPALLAGFVSQLSTKNDVLALNVHRGFHKIPSVFPDARYVHLLRDPRDVGLSSIKMGWAGNTYYGVDHWVETEKSWNELLPHLNDDQFIEVKYEELVSSPEDVLEKICRFLNLEIEQNMFDFFKNSTYGKINQDSLYRWKNELSVEENNAIEYKIADLLNLKRYEIRSDTNQKPHFLTLVKYAIGNKISNWKFGFSRYGARLFLMGKIIKFLPLKGLFNSLHAERNEIDKKLLK